MSNSLRPHGLYLARVLCPLDSPGKNTGVGCHFLLQGTFPTQGSNLGLPCCSHTVCCLGHQEARPLSRAVLTKSMGIRGLPPRPVQFCIWPTVRIYQGLEILNEAVLLEFGLCTCVFPCTRVDTAHVHTHMSLYTHVCPEHCSPNTSHSHSLPDQEPRATSPLSRRLPTEATGQATPGAFSPKDRGCLSPQLRGECGFQS